MTRGWLIGGALFVGALLIASIVVALLEKEEPLPQGTPEAAVQAFLRALGDEDLETAYNLLSGKLKQDCTLSEFFGMSRYEEGRLKEDRIVLEGTRMVDDTAFVTVRVTRVHSPGLFGPSEASFEPRFVLRQEDGEWRFSEYPWPFFHCGGKPPVPVPPGSPEPPTPTPPSGAAADENAS